MTVNSKRGRFSCLLGLYLLVLNSVMAAPSVAHSIEHAHHSNTHSMALCAWICGTGQGVESVYLDLDAPNGYWRINEVFPIEKYDLPTVLETFLRGPPESPL